jgi:ABC-type transporter Mla subunit MlaD
MSEKDKDEQIKELKNSNQILENNLNKIKELHNEEVMSNQSVELTPEESIMDAMVSRQETKIANAKAKIKVATKAPAGVGEHMDGLLNDTEKALQEIADAESILDAIEKHDL